MSRRTKAANRDIEDAVKKARGHANARTLGFGRSLALPDLAGRKVLLVDDGLEEGLTMCAALEELRSWNVSKVVVAAATGSRCGIDRIEGVDAVVCPNIRATQPFRESDAFRHLDDLTDSEVIDVLA
jgi:putative phosphoribosyl transferase